MLRPWVGRALSIEKASEEVMEGERDSVFAPESEIAPLDRDLHALDG
jgi:hypothetical protein